MKVDSSCLGSLDIVDSLGGEEVGVGVFVAGENWDMKESTVRLRNGQ